jgi:hypothetical protein
MKRISIFCLASIFSLICPRLAYGQVYQKIADSTPWSWSADRASVTDSFLRLPNTYQVELIRPKDKTGVVTIRFLDDGKEAFAWMGHYGSVFAMSGDVLVYADFGPGRTGCSLIAYDLKQKKQVWKTALMGLGPINHSRYANAVTLEFIDNATVRVFGNESAGKYLEIVDINTGKTVGHRVYKK